MASNSYSLVITGNCAGQFVQNILSFRMDDAGFSNPVSAAKGLIDGWIAESRHDSFLALCCESYTLKSLKARKLTGGIGPEWIDLSLDGTAGSRSGETQGSSNGPVILLLPANNNRVTGKIFVPGISVSDADRGEISASAIDAFITAGTSLCTNFDAVGGGNPPVEPVILKSGTPTQHYAIDAIEVCKEIGVQRRRQLPV